MAVKIRACLCVEMALIITHLSPQPIINNMTGNYPHNLSRRATYSSLHSRLAIYIEVYNA